VGAFFSSLSSGGGGLVGAFFSSLSRGGGGLRWGWLFSPPSPEEGED